MRAGIKKCDRQPAPKDFAPLEQMQPMRFRGGSWELFREVVNGELSN